MGRGESAGRGSGREGRKRRGVCAERKEGGKIETNLSRLVDGLLSFTFDMK